MNTLIVGDIHGEWGPLNQLIDKKKPNNIIQLGDFGWWPHFHKKKGLLGRGKRFDQFGIKNKDTKIYWIPGNHENWNDLECLTGYEPIEIQDGVTYCPFGTVLEVDNTKILCCGGADSIDKDSRTEGLYWWRQEVITQEDMDNLPNTDIDIVVSHTAPRNWIESVTHEGAIKKDPSTFALQLIFEKYRPKQWFNAHFHKYLNCEIDGCEWTMLATPGVQEQWWIKLI